MNKDLSLIFERKPSQWGLRGDPYLWEEMQEACIGESLDTDAYGIAEFVSGYFQKVTGKPLTMDADVYVERFAHGGISSGYVCGRFWIAKGIPHLIGNLHRVNVGYPVITLCGSTRFKKEFLEVQKKLTYEGRIIMTDIRYEKENNQAAAYDGGKQIGVCQYQVAPGIWTIIHTFTDPEYAGRGIARQMVECVRDQAELAQIKLEATCWYARKVLGLSDAGREL